MNTQLNILSAITEAEKLKQRGMKQAIDHADDVHCGWGQKAFNLLCAWIKEKGSGRQFKGEDFRIHCELTDAIEQPPSDRAYGSIILKAAKAGLIRKVGYAITINPKTHRTPTTLWQII